MPLPTLTNAKNYLRIQTGAEDVVLTALLARAQAMVETFIGVRLVAATETMTDWTTDSGRAYGAPSRLQLPRYPFAITAPVPTVTDTNAATVDPTTYVLDGRTGQIRGTPGITFANGPYAITASVGWSTHPDYVNQYEALAGAAILDIVADLYQRRNPGAASEAEQGVSVQWTADAIPARTRAMLAPLRIGVGA